MIFEKRLKKRSQQEEKPGKSFRKREQHMQSLEATGSLAWQVLGTDNKQAVNRSVRSQRRVAYAQGGDCSGLSIPCRSLESTGCGLGLIH